MRPRFCRLTLRRSLSDSSSLSTTRPLSPRVRSTSFVPPPPAALVSLHRVARSGPFRRKVAGTQRPSCAGCPGRCVQIPSLGKLSLSPFLQRTRGPGLSGSQTRARELRGRLVRPRRWGRSPRCQEVPGVHAPLPFIIIYFDAPVVPSLAAGRLVPVATVGRSRLILKFPRPNPGIGLGSPGALGLPVANTQRPRCGHWVCPLLWGDPAPRLPLEPELGTVRLRALSTHVHARISVCVCVGIRDLMLRSPTLATPQGFSLLRQ